jgi:hypothetical protein
LPVDRTEIIQVLRNILITLESQPTQVRSDADNEFEELEINEEEEPINPTVSKQTDEYEVGHTCYV